MVADDRRFVKVYQELDHYYGPQGWWPADDEFEIMVGAILTQNTAWTNVEKALNQLKAVNAFDASSMDKLPESSLAELIRPSGYFNQKANRLKRFVSWYLDIGGLEYLRTLSLTDLRKALLERKGIGPETADDIVLYAFHHSSFVIDAYTRRLFSRLGIVDENLTYGDLQGHFHDNLPKDAAMYQQYHGLIVVHAKRHCMKRPVCKDCPLGRRCCYEKAQIIE